MRVIKSEDAASQAGSVFFLTTVFFLAACTVLYASIPQWVQNPRSDSERHMYVIGSGQNREQARSNALSNLAGRFSTEVGSQEELVFSEVGDQVGTEYRQQIEARVRDLELDNYEINRSESMDEDNYYVEVRLDKPAYSESVIDRLDRLEKEIEDDFKITPSPLVDFYRMNASLSKIEQAEVYLQVLRILGADINYDERRDKYRDLKANYDKVRGKVQVVIIRDDETAPVANHIEEELASEAVDSVQFDGEPEPAEQYEDWARIIITATTDEDEFFGSKEVTVNVRLEVRSRHGRLLSSQTYEKRGSSMTDFDDARGIAFNDVIAEIEQQGFEKLLGID